MLFLCVAFMTAGHAGYVLVDFAKIHEGKAKKGINKSLGQNSHLPLLRDIITHDRYVPVANSVKQFSQQDVHKEDTSRQATVDSGLCHQIATIPEATKDTVQVILVFQGPDES